MNRGSISLGLCTRSKEGRKPLHEIEGLHTRLDYIRVEVFLKRICALNFFFKKMCRPCLFDRD